MTDPFSDPSAEVLSFIDRRDEAGAGRGCDPGPALDGLVNEGTITHLLTMRTDTPHVVPAAIEQALEAAGITAVAIPGRGLGLRLEPGVREVLTGEPFVLRSLVPEDPHGEEAPPAGPFAETLVLDGTADAIEMTPEERGDRNAAAAPDGEADGWETPAAPSPDAEADGATAVSSPEADAPETGADSGAPDPAGDPAEPVSGPEEAAPPEATTPGKGLEARLDRIEAGLAALSKQEPSGNVAEAANDLLAMRLAEISERIEAVARPASAPDLSGIEQGFDALNAALSDILARIEDVSSRIAAAQAGEAAKSGPAIARLPSAADGGGATSPEAPGTEILSRVVASLAERLLAASQAPSADAGRLDDLLDELRSAQQDLRSSLDVERSAAERARADQRVFLEDLKAMLADHLADLRDSSAA